MLTSSHGRASDNNRQGSDTETRGSRNARRTVDVATVLTRVRQRSDVEDLMSLNGIDGVDTELERHRWLSTFFATFRTSLYENTGTTSDFFLHVQKHSAISKICVMLYMRSLIRNIKRLESYCLLESISTSCLFLCSGDLKRLLSVISPERWEAIMRKNGWNPVDLRDTRYNQIIHMVSAAVGAEAFYSIEDHACRSESVDLAKMLDHKAAEAWVGHPYFDVIDNSTEFDTKIRRCINAVCQKLVIDTGDRLENNARKLKFLVKGSLPEDKIFPSFQDFNVEHIYLRTNSRKMQARLRKRGKNGNNSYTHTIRKPEQLGQVVEVKTQISTRDYNNMSAQADDHHFPIYKTRRCFLYNNQYFQLDIYQEPCHPRCRGLLLLETYTTLSPEELRKRIPEFLGPVEDVKGKPNYSMFNLSLRDEWGITNQFCVNIAAPML
ncbi:unnamed protein product, partial [Meganyctiphanes norvegica]